MESSNRSLLDFYLKNSEASLFLDIETEGLNKDHYTITLIGIYKNEKYYAFIKDLNLEKSLAFLENTPIWITFGGANFDIPFIKRYFPFLTNPKVHIDLFYFTKILGLKGGLKQIEKALNLKRRTEGMNGYDAVKLWQKWEKQRDRSALRKLILYNKEDVVNLKIILDFIIRKLYLEKKVPGDEERIFL